MHLVKWFRKNMNKLMAIFVILIMIAFIMPTVLSQLAKPRFKGPEQAIWRFDTDKTISFNDISKATRELSAMRQLYIDKLLLSQQDLRLFLLAQLIFPEASRASQISDELKSFVIRSRLGISPQRIDEFIQQTGSRAELFWILLKSEAKQAGFSVSHQRAAEVLKSFIPQITNNTIDAQTLVKNAGRANQMTDDMVVATFADIIAVAAYAKAITEIEDITEPQLAALTAFANEFINAEFVEFNSDTFLKEAGEPADEEIRQQFEKYKHHYPGTISEENPFGFGYKQAPAVAVEYMIIKLDDAKKLVTPPTEEECEDFYQRNIEIFTQQIPEDPNDPNSRIISKQKSYAEVASHIRNLLLSMKASNKAVTILQDAVQYAQAVYESINLDTADVNMLREKAIPYADAAKLAETQNKIKIYAGKTGLLTADDILADPDFGSLTMKGQSRMPTGLTRLLFAVDQLGDEAVKLGPFEAQKPKMFVNIGPLTNNTNSIIAMIRVIDTRNSIVPDNINFSYEKNLPALSENRENIFSLKEKIKQDCRKLAAFKIARQKADEFARIAREKGWDAAIEKFRSLYPVRSNNDANSPFEIQKLSRSRVSQADIEVLKLGVSQTPRAEASLNKSIIQAKLTDKFYSLLKDDRLQLDSVPAIVEYEPLQTCYVIKSLSRQPATTQDYEQLRREFAFKEDQLLSQGMAIEHYMPQNIFKRLNLISVTDPNEQKQKSDSNAL